MKEHKQTRYYLLSFVARHYITEPYYHDYALITVEPDNGETLTDILNELRHGKISLVPIALSEVPRELVEVGA